MTKRTKIIIGVSLTLAVGGLITYLVSKNRKPKDDEGADWDIYQDGVSRNTDTTPSKEVIKTRKKNNFEAVKKYFGNSAAVYNNRIIIKRNTAELAKMINKNISDFGVGNTNVSLVYWDNGQFTVKVGDVIAALKGHYYKGGTEIKVSGGVGALNAKKGLIEKDNNPLMAIARAFLR